MLELKTNEWKMYKYLPVWGGEIIGLRMYQALLLIMLCINHFAAVDEEVRPLVFVP
jgi:hypothetical protein